MGLHCLAVHLHLLDELLFGKTALFKFYDTYMYSNFFRCLNVLDFYSEYYWTSPGLSSLFFTEFPEFEANCLDPFRGCILHAVSDMGLLRFFL